MAATTIKVTTPGGEAIFNRLQGTERLSSPFEYQLFIRSKEQELKAETLLTKPAVVTLLTQGSPVRYFHGLITDVTFGGSNLGQADTGGWQLDYQITLRPWLSMLGHTADCRAFQSMTVPDIVQQVCRNAGFTDLRLALSGSYDPHEYCVQFRETDLNFVSRLLEQEGIFYYFEHSQSKHTLVLCDDVAQLTTAPGYDTVYFTNPNQMGATARSEHLVSWVAEKSVRSGKFATREFNFKAPSPILEGTSSISRPYSPERFETFDFPSLAQTPASTSVERMAKVRVEELQTPQMRARGSGDTRGLATGKVFNLKDHRRSDLNIRYLVVATTVNIGTGTEHGAGQFEVSVEAADASQPYRPTRVTPKPLVHGLQSALVVGPSGSEIYTDQYARIKVQFHWDRQGKRDENSSCWIRVAQTWAGLGWGALQLPRVGQEVVVAFLDGDPDRPVIVGSLYNGTQKPPYDLPGKATQSGVKSCSTKDGDPGNELRFEDSKGSEQVYLHAQKDHLVDVKNNLTTTVGKDQSSTVGGNQTLDVSGDITISARGSITLNATSSITLNVGTASVTVSEAGVTVKGLEVTVTGMTLVGITSTTAVNITAPTGAITGPMLVPL